LKNQVQAIVARNLLPRCPAADLFGHKGRRWLAAQELPLDEQHATQALLRQLDFYGGELRAVDAELAKAALASNDTRRLMTIPGVDVTVAISVVAAIGDWSRFPTADKLVAYLGLNPGSASPATSRQRMGGSPSSAVPTPGACSSKQRGPQRRRPARCGPSTSGSRPAEACRSQSWRPPASWSQSAGT
jgi:transposase